MNTERFLEPMRRQVARVVRLARLRDRDPRLVGAIDAPTRADVFGTDLPLIGWAGSTDGHPVRVKAVVGGLDLCDISTTEPRVDVIGKYRKVDSMCGFNTRVLRPPLPDQPTYRVDLVAYTPSKQATVASVEVQWLASDLVPSQRADYRRVWESVVHDEASARYAVAGYVEDDEWNRTGEISAQTLHDRLVIAPTDTVLEIGCGAGRIGAHLSRRCGTWVGADVSAGMLDTARAALADSPNVEFVQLTGSDLASVPTETIDKVYCTVVFMHLDEWDRYRYVQEMFRVLKSGGRAYFDNYDLLSDEGWRLFEQTCSLSPELRPLNVSKSSTAAELRRYADKAGFVDVDVREQGLFVTVSARKP